MKTKTVLLLCILLTSTLAYSQYARTLFELETGAGKLENVAKVGYGNIHVNARHNFNPYVGVKAGVGYTTYYDYEIMEASIQGVFNLGRLAQFETFAPNTTLLVFAGPSITDSNYPTNETIIFRDTHFNPVIGFQLEQRITDGLFFGVGVNRMSGINYRPTSDLNITNKWEFNAFVSVPILNGNDVHADFYIPERVNDTIFMKPTIIDNSKTIINNIPVKQEEVIVRGEEYVFFKHDSSNIDKDGLANIEKAFQSGATKFRVIAYCSNVGSYNYNVELGKRRAGSVADRLYLLAKSNGTFITVEEVSKSIDYDRTGINDAARRVIIEYE